MSAPAPRRASSILFSAGRTAVLFLATSLVIGCAAGPPTSDRALPAAESEAHRDAADRSLSGQPDSVPEGALQDGDDHQDHNEHEHDPGVVELTEAARLRAGLRVEPVVLKALAGRLRATGRVDFDPRRRSHVSPRIEGRIHRVGVELGDPVRAGEPLIWMDSLALGHAKTAYLTARSERDLARTHLERIEALFADGIAAHQRVLEARAALQEASAELSAAAEALRLYGLEGESLDGLRFGSAGASLTALSAPFDGTVVEMHATLGERVDPSRSLLTVADLDQVWIWIDIYQRDLGRVHLGDEARATVDAFPGRVFAGTVSYLSASVDEDTRTVRAKLEVANPDGRLRPGMFVDVEILDPHAAEGADRTMRAPVKVVAESALVRAEDDRDGSRARVFVELAEGRYTSRAVRLGRRSGSLVELLDGPAVGERVVVEGAFILKSVAAEASLGGGHSH